MYISGKNAVIELCPAGPDWIYPADCYYNFDQMAVDAKINQKRGVTKVPRYGGPPVALGGYTDFALAGKLFLDLTVGRLTFIAVTNGGSGYTSNPTVTITGGAGSGAAAKAIINTAGNVVAVVITAWGTGYTSAPTIGFTGGAGSGAAATATINQYSDVVFNQLKDAEGIRARISLVGVGASTKRPYYTGEIVPTQADIDPAVEGAVAMSFAGDGTGSIVRAEY